MEFVRIAATKENYLSMCECMCRPDRIDTEWRIVFLAVKIYAHLISMAAQTQMAAIKRYSIFYGNQYFMLVFQVRSACETQHIRKHTKGKKSSAKNNRLLVWMNRFVRSFQCRCANRCCWFFSSHCAKVIRHYYGLGKMV